MKITQLIEIHYAIAIGEGKRVIIFQVTLFTTVSALKTWLNNILFGQILATFRRCCVGLCRHLTGTTGGYRKVKNMAGFLTITRDTVNIHICGGILTVKQHIFKSEYRYSSAYRLGHIKN